MKIKKLTFNTYGYPKALSQTSGAPKELYYLCKDTTDILSRRALAVIGSRKPSPYGRQITLELTERLAEAGLVIVSGLALGVDALAHRAAIETGGRTIAVLPCGLDRIYPASHRSLAQRILETGGMLISEYPPGTSAFKQNFIARNRIISGLCEGVLITEAAERSGSLHTARFALEQGREVFAAPGNITSPCSAGTNNLIKAGASPVTQAEDMLFVLNIKSRNKNIVASNAEEQIVLDGLANNITNTDELLEVSGLSTEVFNRTITMLELRGKIKPLGGGQWRLG